MRVRVCVGMCASVCVMVYVFALCECDFVYFGGHFSIQNEVSAWERRSNCSLKITAAFPIANL
jgi:hypothetical protein